MFRSLTILQLDDSNNSHLTWGQTKQTWKMCILGRPNKNIYEVMIYLSSLLRFFKSSEQRTALRYGNRGSEWKTDRQTDKDRARWADTGKQRKEENTSVLQGRRESLSAGCFDFILPLSAADGEMVRVGDAKELSDEWTSVHGPPASENAPITTQLLLHTNLNGPNGAQWMVFVPNNTRVRGSAPSG